MTTISAKSVLASRHAADPLNRIDTLLLRYPRCIHAEFMTHRMFSRNAASSRAIPVEKLIKAVMDDPFIPLHWGKNQKGMQGGAELDAPVEVPKLDDIMPNQTQKMSREAAWLEARDRAVELASAFACAGYHKQIVNRLLEPFAHITVVVTSTKWSNFLALRDHPDAEPHIQLLAKEVRKALNNARVQSLYSGAWHLPFANSEEECVSLVGTSEERLKAAIKLSVARCASTSYKTVDGFDMTLERAQDMYDKLYTAKPIHASPFEHQAQADRLIQHLQYEDDTSPPEFSWPYSELSGNLGPGWVQLRKTLPDECL